MKSKIASYFKSGKFMAFLPLKWLANRSAFKLFFIVALGIIITHKYLPLVNVIAAENSRDFSD
ncbi:MAG TPA: hypothetical protein V6D21_02075, partial [Candidatus Obscuribacterales bacterium]